MLKRVLTPYRLPLTKIDRTVRRTATHHYALFEAAVPPDVWSALENGVSGKVVSKEFAEGSAPWKEILKARIHSYEEGHVRGELHLAGSQRFRAALQVVRVGDLVEIDPFGVTSKLESALSEAAFFLKARQAGWMVTRMPENVAKHLGTQNYYDFRLERRGFVVRVELKSLWGTDTTQCRLIHTKSPQSTRGKNAARADRQIWRNSSCRFEDQDIFAVNMWLRTGRITDFVYALSVPRDMHPWGLPATRHFPEHVVQNIIVSDPPHDPWNEDLEEAVSRYRSILGKYPDLAERLGGLSARPSRRTPVDERS